MERKANKIKIFIGLIVIMFLAFGNYFKSTKKEKVTTKIDEIEKTVIIGLPGISNQTLEATGVALSKGYIEEELEKVGYKAEVVYFQQAGPALNEALATNKIDVAMYGDLPITVLKSNGGDIKVFAVDNSRFIYGVFVQNDDNINTVKDLEGKKVIYGKGTVQQKFFKEILKKYNLDESKFSSVNAIGADAQSIFSAKEADAIFAFYYTTLFMESKGMGKVIDSTADKPEISTQSLVVGRTKFLNENEEVPVAIIKALERAREFSQDNPDKVFEIFSRSNIPAEIFKKAYSNDLTFSNFDPKITEESKTKMQNLINFLYDNQLVKNKISVDDIFTTEYYEKAKK